MAFRFSLQWQRVLEVLAVVLNLLYTVFYLNHSHWCFLFGVLGPLSLACLCFQRRIYADGILQFVYVALALYGFFHVGDTWAPLFLTKAQHALFLVSSLVVMLLVYAIMKRVTDNASPLLDSFCATFALTGTLLMMLLVHENWLYFIAVNAASVFLYARRKLYLTAALFCLYWLMSLDGFFRWGLFTFAS